MSAVRTFINASLLCCSALCTLPAQAEETSSSGDFTVSGYVEAVTDYRWRGTSISAGDAAIQGSINVSHSSGIYVGTWASSIEDSDTYGSSEFDFYAGWTGEVASGLTADVGMYLYAYPNGHMGDANAFEPYASLSTDIGPVTGKVGVAYAWKQDSLGGQDNLYLSTDLSSQVPGVPVTLSAHLGYTDGAWSPNVLTGKSTKGGFDYALGASYDIAKNLKVSATYIGVDGYSLKSYSNDTVVGSLRLSF
jgi:uncharacterized protein (TIGR02001 family)